MADSIEQQIEAASEAYRRAIWRIQLDDADRYWAEIQRLRMHRCNLWLAEDFTADLPPDEIVTTR